MICFLTEAQQTDGKDRFTLKDMMKTSVVTHASSSFIRDDAERHSPVLPHCVWVLAASVRGHNNSRGVS